MNYILDPERIAQIVAARRIWEGAESALKRARRERPGADVIRGLEKEHKRRWLEFYRLEAEVRP